MLVLEFVTDALRDIGVIGETQSPSAEQGSTGVRKLNELMGSLLEDGIDLGYNAKSSTADTIDEISLGLRAGIKAMLGASLAPIYGAEVPASVSGVASGAYLRLLGRVVSQEIERAQSNTLPVGENQRYGYNILTDG